MMLLWISPLLSVPISLPWVEGYFFHWKVKVSVSYILGLKPRTGIFSKMKFFGLKQSVIFICKIIVAIAPFSAT